MLLSIYYEKFIYCLHNVFNNTSLMKNIDLEIVIEIMIEKMKHE